MIPPSHLSWLKMLGWKWTTGPLAITLTVLRIQPQCSAIGVARAVLPNSHEYHFHKIILSMDWAVGGFPHFISLCRRWRYMTALPPPIGRRCWCCCRCCRRCIRWRFRCCGRPCGAGAVWRRCRCSVNMTLPLLPGFSTITPPFYRMNITASNQYEPFIILLHSACLVPLLEHWQPSLPSWISSVASEGSCILPIEVLLDVISLACCGSLGERAIRFVSAPF